MKDFLLSPLPFYTLDFIHIKISWCFQGKNAIRSHASPRTDYERNCVERAARTLCKELTTNDKLETERYKSHM